MNDRTDHQRILILGGYGTFGQRITRALAKQGYEVLVNGRHQASAQKLIQRLRIEHPGVRLSAACFDIHQHLEAQLKRLNPWLVIHTSGPFQTQHADIAEMILSAGCHYIDLADSRQYVKQMNNLDGLAKQQQVTAITGASTVPALSSAVLTWLQKNHQISHFKHIQMGITPGQKTPRGLATTRAVLSYLGKPLEPWTGSLRQRHGWMDTYLQNYPHIGRRLMANCEAPDLDLLADHFSLDELQFSAGMGSKVLHLLMWLTAVLVRTGLPLKLERRAAFLLKISHWFDVLGTEDGGMHVNISALDADGKEIKLQWFLEAFAGCGPQIPAVPAILLTEKIHHQALNSGVHPCVNLLTLDEYLNGLSGLNISTRVQVIE